MALPATGKFNRALPGETTCEIMTDTMGCDCIGIMAVELDKQLIGLV